MQNEEAEKTDEQEAVESENMEESEIDKEYIASDEEWDLYAPSPSRNVTKQHTFTSLNDPEEMLDRNIDSAVRIQRADSSKKGLFRAKKKASVSITIKISIICWKSVNHNMFLL